MRIKETPLVSRVRFFFIDRAHVVLYLGETIVYI